MPRERREPTSDLGGKVRVRGGKKFFSNTSGRGKDGGFYFTDAESKKKGIHSKIHPQKERRNLFFFVWGGRRKKRFPSNGAHLDIKGGEKIRSFSVGTRSKKEGKIVAERKRQRTLEFPLSMAAYNTVRGGGERSSYHLDEREK